MKNYIKLEQNIISAFCSNPFVFFNNRSFQVVDAFKPRPIDNKGECKTDVFVLLTDIDTGEPFHLKISVKMKCSHNWQESKLTYNRCLEIFGPNFESIISKNAKKISDLFCSTPLFYRDKYSNISPNSLTMGWRLEITRKKRRLSVPLDLPNKTIVDSFYKGSNLSENKKNCLRKNTLIKDAGVANYILYIDNKDSTDIDFILSNLISLDDYKAPQLYLSFIANNYRFSKNKIDGNRYLAVSVTYSIHNNKIYHQLEFDHPLSRKGRDLSKKLLKNLKMPITEYDFDPSITFKKSTLS